MGLKDQTKEGLEEDPVTVELGPNLEAISRKYIRFMVWLKAEQRAEDFRDLFACLAEAWGKRWTLSHKLSTPEHVPASIVPYVGC